MANVFKQLRAKARGGPMIRTKQDAIAGANAYNRALRGGKKATLSGAASTFISENPNATSKNAKRLNDKYR